MKKSLAIVITLVLMLVGTVPALAVDPVGLQGGGVSGLSQGEVSQMIVDGESANGITFWGPSSVSSDSKVGTGSIKIPVGSTIQKFDFTVSVDDTYSLSFWVKSTAVTDGIWHWSLPMIKIFTGGGTDNGLQYWPSKTVLAGPNVWTKFVLPLSAIVDPDNTTVSTFGTVDLSNITGFQIDGRAEGDMYIDDVKLLKTNTKLLLDGESGFGLSLWGSSSISTDSKVGKGSIKIPVGSTIQKFDLSISADASYYLSFWVKSTAVTDGIWHWSLPMLRLFTGGSTTTNCIRIWPSKKDLLGTNVWTRIMVPLTTYSDPNYCGTEIDGVVDLSDITGIQIDGRAEGDMYIDDIKLVKADSIDDSAWDKALPIGNKVSVDNANGSKGLVLHQVPVGGDYSGSSMTGKLNAFTTDGMGSYKIMIPAGDITLQSIWGTGFSAIELPNSKEQFVSLDLYIPDKNIISTDTANAWQGKLYVSVAYNSVEAYNYADSMSWWINPTSLNNGWNRLILPVNSTDTANQQLDYGTVERAGQGPNKNGVFAVNQYRIGFISTAATTDFSIDNINIISKSTIQAVDLSDYIIKNVGYTENVFTNILPNTKVSDFKTSLSVASGIGVVIKNAQGTDVTNSTVDIIGTGTTLEITEYSIPTLYTLVIYGDLDSNGLIELEDLVLVRNSLLETDELQPIPQIAGDLYGDGITLNVLVGIMASVSENGAINQNR